MRRLGQLAIGHTLKLCVPIRVTTASTIKYVGYDDLPLLQAHKSMWSPN